MDLTRPIFTILLPVHREPIFLPFALQSVLEQHRHDFEVFVICDGAPQATVEFANSAADADPRIKVFSFPKGEGHGETYRDKVLSIASGQLCCQIADDDLWFPHHLDEIACLLSGFDFGNLLHTYAVDENEMGANFYDLADPVVQQRMKFERWNFFGPTVAGYRMEVYRRLQQKWAPAPSGLWSDLAMWRRFLSLPDISVGSRMVVTSIHFPTSLRKDWSMERRLVEISKHSKLMHLTEHHNSVSQNVLQSVAGKSSARYLRRVKKRNRRLCLSLLRSLLAGRSENDAECLSNNQRNKKAQLKQSR